MEKMFNYIFLIYCICGIDTLKYTIGRYCFCLSWHTSISIDVRATCSENKRKMYIPEVDMRIWRNQSIAIFNGTRGRHRSEWMQQIASEEFVFLSSLLSINVRIFFTALNMFRTHVVFMNISELVSIIDGEV